MFLIAPLHCFYRLLFGFLLSTTAVLSTSTAHTCTYTAVRYCSTTELAPLLDEEDSSALNFTFVGATCRLCWAKKNKSTSE